MTFFDALFVFCVLGLGHLAISWYRATRRKRWLERSILVGVVACAFMAITIRVLAIIEDSFVLRSVSVVLLLLEALPLAYLQISWQLSKSRRNTF